MSSGARRLHRRRSIRGSLEYVLRPLVLRRSLVTAGVVGSILSLINQGHILAEGDATVGTWVRIAVNFLVPFVVVNIGALGGAPDEKAVDPDRSLKS